MAHRKPVPYIIGTSASDLWWELAGVFYMATSETGVHVYMPCVYEQCTGIAKGRQHNTQKLC